MTAAGDFSNEQQRLRRALDSFEGLSVGDAFGEQYFLPHAESAIAARLLTPAPWHVTDDTIMAVSVVENLRQFGRIDQDHLAAAFARRFAEQPNRGYGATAGRILRQVGEGVPWRAAATEVFEGQGSRGNGAAMRAGPIGAYFADDVAAVIQNAIASAEVTHAHLDGQAGAIAVAVAAAYAARCRCERRPFAAGAMFDLVLEATPHSPTREGILVASKLDPSYRIETAVRALGNGAGVISSDTVPLTLWCAARHADSFNLAMWTTVAALGDRDTTCAIVGSILACLLGVEAIPADWMSAREAIPSRDG